MSSRRLLDATMDDQATIAANHLVNLEASKLERMDLNYPLASLRRSASNPRRMSLDNAGVTDESIAELTIKPREGLESWSARLDAYLDLLERKGVSPKSFSVWSELFDLAISIFTTDLLQPIICKMDGEIIAGERRWTASILAGKSHSRVILRQVPQNMENLYRLIENLQRSDLSVAETAMSLRTVMEDTTGTVCGPDNAELTIQKIQSVLGAGQTQSAYYRAICRLPDGDPLLGQILSGAYTSLRTAYEDSGKRLRELQSGTRAVSQNGLQVESPPPPARPPKRDTLPTLKARLPGTEGGLRVFAALEGIDGIASETLERLQAIRTGWAGAPDKARKKMIGEALDKLFSDLDVLDDEDAP